MVSYSRTAGCVKAYKSKCRIWTLSPSLPPNLCKFNHDPRQTIGLHVFCSLADTKEFCLEVIATVYVIFRTYSWSIWQKIKAFPPLTYAPGGCGPTPAPPLLTFCKEHNIRDSCFWLPCCLSWLSSEIPWIIALPDVRDFQAALNCLWFVVVERRERRLNFISSAQSEKITQRTNNHSFFIPKPDSERRSCFCFRTMSL